MAQDRPTIPADIKRELLQECGHRCAVCGMDITEIAHIIPWSKVQSHEKDNLICLCPNDHTRAHREKWSTETLLWYKKHPRVNLWNGEEGGNGAYIATTLTLRLNYSDYNPRRKREIECAIAGLLGIPPDEVAIVACEPSNSILVTVLLPSKCIIPEDFQSAVSRYMEDAKTLAGYLRRLLHGNLPRREVNLFAYAVAFTAISISIGVSYNAATQIKNSQSRLAAEAEAYIKRDPALGLSYLHVAKEGVSEKQFRMAGIGIRIDPAIELPPDAHFVFELAQSQLNYSKTLKVDGLTNVILPYVLDSHTEIEFICVLPIDNLVDVQFDFGGGKTVVLSSLAGIIRILVDVEKKTARVI